jgi:hypothetical protein
MLVALLGGATWHTCTRPHNAPAPVLTLPGGQLDPNRLVRVRVVTGFRLDEGGATVLMDYRYVAVPERFIPADVTYQEVAPEGSGVIQSIGGQQFIVIK